MLLWQILVRDAKKLRLATSQEAAREFLEDLTGEGRDFDSAEWSTWRNNLRVLKELAEVRGKPRPLSRPACTTVSEVLSGIRVGVALNTLPGQRDLLDQAPTMFFTNSQGERIVPGPDATARDQTSFWQELFYEFFDPEHATRGYCETFGCSRLIEPTPTGRPSKQKKCGACLTSDWYYRDHEKKKAANKESQAKRRKRLKEREKQSKK